MDGLGGGTGGLTVSSGVSGLVPWQGLDPFPVSRESERRYRGCGTPASERQRESDRGGGPVLFVGYEWKVDPVCFGE